MKLKHLASILFLIPAITLAGNQEAEIRQSLEMWEPKKIEVKNSVLSIITKERRVTDTIYQAIIRAGVCMGTISRKKSLVDISEIRVLNQFGHQGYVFEGGISECNEIVKMTGSKTKIYILGRTHMHTNQ